MTASRGNLQKRYDELPKGWATAQLAELGKLHCGQSLSPSQVNTNGSGVLYVTGPEQWDGHVVRQDKWTTSPKRIAPDGSIFITVKGAGIGKMCRGLRAAIGRDVYAFEPSTELDAEFLYYALRHTIDAVIGAGKGDIPGLSKSHILDHAISLPGKIEQSRIVAKIDELFSELDNGIENLKTAREQLNAYRQALLNAAFHGRLTKDWRQENLTRIEPAEDVLVRLNCERQNRYSQATDDWRSAVKAWEANGKGGRKPSKPTSPDPIDAVPPNEAAELPALPDGWLWVCLGGVCDVSGGLTKNEKKREMLPRRMKYLRVANVYADRLELSEIHEIAVTDDEAAKVTLQAGDLLIVEGNGSVDQIGRVAMWSGEVPECGHQNHLIKARIQLDCPPRYLLQFLLSPVGRDLIIKQASSTTGLHTLSISKVSNLPVPVASVLEQVALLAAIDEKLSAVDAVASEIDTQLARAEALRQSILRRAFSGQLVPQDPGDEPAAALLERIRAAKVQAGTKNVMSKKRKSAA